ncbi:glycoside hydrolase superfamily [Gorgonomyces haynaldii]|nr:glycoside hydrolase superfamily [Gorgonomyces haynaldii]
MLTFQLVCGASASGFVTTNGARFQLDGQPLFVFSANYWQAMNLGAPDAAAGNRTRLLRDLDKLQSFGVNHLRIMAASEGPDTEPFRMTPSLMPAPGVYNQDVLDGLDFAMAEIGKRGMKATLCLNNRWPWSGGFPQYVTWVSGITIPYPPGWDPEIQNITTTGDWNVYTNHADSFWSDPEMRKRVTPLFKKHMETIINRTNKYTGRQYKDDTTVFAWQLANEPGGPPTDWFDEFGSFVKQLAPNHMVSAGLESNRDEANFDAVHSSAYIDYCTNHVWAQNSNEYNMWDSSEANINHAISWGLEQVNHAHSWALKYNKPLIFEEFGLARDNWVAGSQTSAIAVYSPENPTTNKDRYYNALLKRVVELHNAGGRYAGFGFWAYAGESRPGDKWIADPPHEPPGWYSVYDKDISTIKIMQDAFQSVQIR